MINYQPIVQVLAVFGLLFGVFNQTIMELVGRWLVADESQSHGLMVVVIAIYLAVRMLKVSAKVNLKEALAGIIMLSLFSFCWYIAAAVNLEIIEQLLLLPILFSFFWAIFGFNSAASVLGAISFLVFAIPVWDYLTPYLVQMSSDVVTWMVSQTGITSYISGSTISLPHGTLVIADGCSGLRYLIISLVLAAYILLTSTTSLKQKIIMVVLAASLGLLVNWLRIFIIVLIANETQMKSSLVEDHEAFGWFLFVLVCIPIVLFGRQLTPLKFDSAQTKWVPNAYIMAFAIIALILGPLYKKLQEQWFDAPGKIQWELAGFNLLNERQADFHAPKAELFLEKKIEVAGTVYKGFVVINRQVHPQDSLVPYWPKPFNARRWQFIEDGLYSTDGTLDYTMIRLDQIPFGQGACLAIRYRVGDFGTSRYTVAKLLQIPAMISKQNLFVAFGVFFEIGHKRCDAHKEGVADALKILSSELDSLAIDY